MKQKFILWLSLLAVFNFMLQSCRNDHFLEQETYSNSSKFNLSSKTISLNESKHQLKLIAELDKVQTELKSIKTNVSGKVVNYGNGVSIDTDNVIYIENGSNYHTYTFKINRENAPIDAPVENLLLVPLPDGSYRELLVVYNLTAQEKQKILSGIGVDTKGKTTITELTKGTFNGGGQLAKTTCGYKEETYWQDCSEHIHNQSNVNEWVNCTASTKPSVYTVVSFRCWEEQDETIDTTPIDGGTSDGGGTSGNTGTGGGATTEPCDTTIPTSPEQGLTDPNGCPIGSPTLPNLGITINDPCKLAKGPTSTINATLHTPSIATEMSSLENHAANSFTEYGTAIINTGTSIIAADPYSNNNPNNPGQVSITVPSVGDYLANAHTHPGHGAAPPSAKDFYNVLSNAKEYPTYQGSFVFCANGTKYALVVKDRAKAEAFLNAYPLATNTEQPDGKKFNEHSVVGRDYLSIVADYQRGRLPSYSGSSQNDGLESAWAQILEKYDTGISIAKTDNTGNLKPLRSVAFEYEIPASGGKKITGYKAMPCP